MPAARMRMWSAACACGAASCGTASARSLTALRGTYSYRHNGLEWRCKVVVCGQDIRAHALHWWQHGPKGHRNEALDAILLRGHLMPLHFDSHFFSRWGLRSELMGVMLTNMMGFFKQYHDLPMRSLKRIHNGHQA